MFKESNKWRIPVRFSLKTLFVVVTMVCIIVFIVVQRYHHAQEQQRVVEAILKQGGWVVYDYQVEEDPAIWWSVFPPPKGAIRELLGDDFFPSGKTVVFGNVDDSIASLDLLKKLSRLHTLVFPSPPKGSFRRRERSKLEEAIPGVKLSGFPERPPSLPPWPPFPDLSDLPDLSK